MRQTAITFKGKKLSLDGVLTTPEDVLAPYPALLVCHPHPKLGGSMDNAVVMAICRAADAEGVASLRFNFRGVGASEGEFDNGVGEQDDVKAALDMLGRWPDVDGRRLGLVGYSFGASVVLAGMRQYKAARGLVFIAPPVSSLEGSRVRKDKRPKLFIVGQMDGVVSSPELQREIDAVRAPVQFTEVEGADHGLGAHEEDVARRVVEFATAYLVQ